MKKTTFAIALAVATLSGCSQSSEPTVTSTQPPIVIQSTTEPIASTSIPPDSEYVNPNHIEPVVVDTFCLGTTMVDEFGDEISDENGNADYYHLRMLLWSNGAITAADFFDPIQVGGYPRQDGSDGVDGALYIEGKTRISCLKDYP
jgi:hypothetical protein